MNLSRSVCLLVDSGIGPTHDWGGGEIQPTSQPQDTLQEERTSARNTSEPKDLQGRTSWLASISCVAVFLTDRNEKRNVLESKREGSIFGFPTVFFFVSRYLTWWCTCVASIVHSLFQDAATWDVDDIDGKEDEDAHLFLFFGFWNGWYGW